MQYVYFLCRRCDTPRAVGLSLRDPKRIGEGSAVLGGNAWDTGVLKTSYRTGRKQRVLIEPYPVVHRMKLLLIHMIETFLATSMDALLDS